VLPSKTVASASLQPLFVSVIWPCTTLSRHSIPREQESCSAQVIVRLWKVMLFAAPGIGLMLALTPVAERSVTRLDRLIWYRFTRP
jgi:hypothetical protein